MTRRFTDWTQEQQEYSLWYQGEVDYLNGRNHGKGVMIQAGYDLCVGYFRCGRFDGPCLFIQKDGTKRIRNFRFGALNGECVTEYPDGQIEKSMWKDNVDLNPRKPDDAQ